MVPVYEGGSRPAVVAASALSVAAIRALAPAGPVQVDGVLDEAAWDEAAIIAELTQQDPHPGEPTPFATEVRVLVDSENVYLAFRCIDPEPDRIAAAAQCRRWFRISSRLTARSASWTEEICVMMSAQ